MRITSIMGICILLTSVAALAQDNPAATPSAPMERPICVLTDAPLVKSQYVVIRNMKLGKGTYGSVNDILPRFLDQARSLGADAIINYAGSQRFGLFPWRFVRPVVRGTAIRWAKQPPPSCIGLGGTER